MADGGSGFGESSATTHWRRECERQRRMKLQWQQWYKELLKQYTKKCEDCYQWKSRAEYLFEEKGKGKWGKPDGKKGKGKDKGGFEKGGKAKEGDKSKGGFEKGGKAKEGDKGKGGVEKGGKSMEHPERSPRRG